MNGRWRFLESQLFYLRERLTGYHSEKREFKRITGNSLNLKNPETYSEKIVWKKIYDRNPLLPIVADKYRVRFYLKEVLGKENAKRILVPLLYVTDRPETIPFNNLPQEYIIKPNHTSGKYIIVEKNNRINPQSIIEQCRQWLRKPYGVEKHEWAYQKIERKIVIEELLRDSNGRIPDDYKFFIIHGKCHLIEFISERFKNMNIDFYSPEWNYLDIKRKGWDRAGYQSKPENLESMIRLSELLGTPFDSIRVDLYSFDGKIYFGELTNYSASGRFIWIPVSFNYELGAKWKIVPGYWKQDPYTQKLIKTLNLRGR